MLPCQGRQVELEYKGNKYTDFFIYPNPVVFHPNQQEVANHYSDCQALIKKNPFYQQSES